MSLDRRTFLQLAALSSGGLLLGITPGCANPQQVRMEDIAGASGRFSPNVFLTITPDDRVFLAMNKSEMGQGVMTGAAAMIAEELEVPLEKIEPFHTAKNEFRTSVGEAAIETSAGMQITGGSSSTPENWVPMRTAGACAREMLVLAAAKTWGVSASECTAKAGAVIHTDGRKLTYGELSKTAASIPLVENPKLKKPGEFNLIGSRVTRTDAFDKVTGRAVFGADVRLEDLHNAYVIHPPTMGAQASSFDAVEAKKMTGVLDVFAFERGVAVVAKKYWQARAAAATVKVEWSGGLLNGLNSDAMMRDQIKQLEESGTHTLEAEGDVDDALERDDVTVVDVVFDAPFLAHAPMETQNAIVWVREDDVRVWTPNQSPTIIAEGVARVVGVDMSDVKVETPMLGGGFGRKAAPDFACEAAMIAKRVDKPVRVIWTREYDTQAGYYRPQAVARMRGAIDKRGNVLAYSYHGVSQSIFRDMSSMMGAMYPEWIPTIGKRLMVRAGVGFLETGSFADFLATEGVTKIPYAIPNVRVEYTPVKTSLPVMFWRSVGHSFNGFMKEVFMDELAIAAKKDPYTFRRDLIKDSPRDLAVLNKVAEMSNWGEPVEDGWGRGIAVHKSFGTYVAEVVEAGIVDGRIKVRKVWCAVDCGIAINPDVVHAQMEGGIVFGLSAAIDQKIELKDGVVQQGNFDSYPMIRMFESPKIEVAIVNSGEDPTGVGEPGLPPVAPALSNALYQATGVRLRSMPMQDAWDKEGAK